ncbi:DUF2079 domain-containing protein [Actinobaculum suis]|uniref:DUF2079 domain-containing protein n=1 Tax=Actinobaculum suis TaxID=1657 RepID=UPI00069F1206|nr:DUF2079 domain-containing protein [Actinobaculum suis]
MRTSASRQARRATSRPARCPASRPARCTSSGQARRPRFGFCRGIDPVAAGLAIFAGAIYVIFSAYTWRNFNSISWDQGIFTQLADQYARGIFPPIVDIKAPGYNLWGDHFHPILLLTGPLFRLWPSGMMLLALQSALFALSVYPIVKLARQHTRYWLLVAAAYILSWGLTSALVVQFHEIAFALPLLAFGITNWIWGKRARACAQIALLVFVKEDLGFTVIAFAAVIFLRAYLERLRARPAPVSGANANATVYQGAEVSTGTVSGGNEVSTGPAICGRNEVSTGAAGAANTVLTDDAAPAPRVSRARTWWHAGLATLRSCTGLTSIFLALWGLAWFLLATQVFLPYFSGAGEWEYVTRVEADSAPGLAGWLMPANVKLPTLLWIAAGLGLIGLRSPWALLLVPTLLWRFAGNNPYYWTILWHYSAVLMPIMSVALVDGLARIRAEAQAKSALGAAPSASRLQKLAGYAAVLALCGAITGTSTNGFGHWATGQGNTQGWNSVAGYGDAQSARQQAAARAGIAAVGQGRTVVTDVVTMAYVVPGNRVLWEHSYAGAEPEIDTVFFSNRLHHGNGLQVALWATEKFGGTWDIVSDKSGYVVVMKEGTY